jgi:hypothetical protein
VEIYKAQCVINKAGAERWTDNTYQMKSHLTKKRGLMSKEVDQLLGCGGDTFDDVAFKKPRQANKRKR